MIFKSFIKKLNSCVEGGINMAVAEVIKFEGPQDALVWKNGGREYMISGNEKFNALSQLIVEEFHEAILFSNGMALDLFKAGRYTLSTQNIPMLSKMYENIVDGSPFPCKVYFINKVHQLELKWGTQGGITLNDPIYDIFLHVGCCGTMAVRISDSRKFLLKFVGNKDVFENKDLLMNLRGIISSNVKNFISKIMIQGKVSFFDMNAHIFDIGQLVAKVLGTIFDGYGLSIEQFNIETIDVPKEDYEEINKAKSLNTSRKIQGFTWQEEQMNKILDDAAKNEGAGNMMGTGMGIGMGFGMGAPMGQAFGNMGNSIFGETKINSGKDSNQTSKPTQINNNGGENLNINNFFNAGAKDQSNDQSTTICPSCGAKLANGVAFCSFCGAKQQLTAVCPTCHAQVEGSAMFCSFCGTKLK